MNKIYRNKHDMLAIVRPDGTAVWLHSLEPVYMKPRLEEWEEMVPTALADIHDLETTLVGSLRFGDLTIGAGGIHVQGAENSVQR
jgi:hypothetical protein